MTNQSAIDVLSNANLGGVLREAADMAISALRVQDKERFVEVNKKIEPLTLEELREMDGEWVWLTADHEWYDGWYKVHADTNFMLEGIDNDYYEKAVSHGTVKAFSGRF